MTRVRPKLLLLGFCQRKVEEKEEKNFGVREGHLKDLEAGGAGVRNVHL